MEIPKDGKGYLAWHKDYGSCLVHWSDILGYFAAYDWRIMRSHEHVMKDLSQITGWMDSKGQWHEVNDE